MDYYSRGSSAYDFTLFEEDTRRRPSARVDRDMDEAVGIENDNNTDKQNTTTDRDRSNRRNTKKSARRSRANSNIIRAAIGAVVAAVVIFIVASIIHGQVQLTELNQEIANAKAQLAEQQSVYTQLQMKVDSSISTTAVEEYAKDKLKMTKAANSQKEFVNLSEGDKAEVSMSSDKSIFESIADAFASLWS